MAYVEEQRQVTAVNGRVLPLAVERPEEIELRAISLIQESPPSDPDEYMLIVESRYRGKAGTTAASFKMDALVRDVHGATTSRGEAFAFELEPGEPSIDELWVTLDEDTDRIDLTLRNVK